MVLWSAIWASLCRARHVSPLRLIVAVAAVPAICYLIVADFGHVYLTPIVYVVSVSAKFRVSCVSQKQKVEGEKAAIIGTNGGSGGAIRFVAFALH